jgi:hypothetical protein
MMQISKKNNTGVRLVIFARLPAGNASRLKAIKLSLFFFCSPKEHVTFFVLIQRK